MSPPRDPVRLPPGIAVRTRRRVAVFVQEVLLADIAHRIDNNSFGKSLGVVDRISRYVEILRPGQLGASGIFILQRRVSQIISHDNVAFPVNEALDADLVPGGIGGDLLQICRNLSLGYRSQKQQAQKNQ